ncbi:hypothetical protein KUCAC02_021644, partial [Chaenocephalus aceratus]
SATHSISHISASAPPKPHPGPPPKKTLLQVAAVLKTRVLEPEHISGSSRTSDNTLYPYERKQQLQWRFRLSSSTVAIQGFMTEVTELTSGIPTDKPLSAPLHTGHQAYPHRCPALLSSPSCS